MTTNSLARWLMQRQTRPAKHHTSKAQTSPEAKTSRLRTVDTSGESNRITPVQARILR